MNRSTSIIYLSLSALGGFLVFPVLPKYSIMLVLSGLFAWQAYVKISKPLNRILLILFSLIDIIIGLLVGLFFADPGRISDVGILILIPSFIMNLPFIWKIYQSEADLDD